MDTPGYVVTSAGAGNRRPGPKCIAFGGSVHLESFGNTARQDGFGLSSALVIQRWAVPLVAFSDDSWTATVGEAPDAITGSGNEMPAAGMGTWWRHRCDSGGSVWSMGIRPGEHDESRI